MFEIEFFEDAKRRGTIGAKGDELGRYLQENCTAEELAIAKIETEIAGAIIKARREKNISQKRLAELTGMQQPTIAKIERNSHSPQVDTLQRILSPLGLRLAVVPM